MAGDTRRTRSGPAGGLLDRLDRIVGITQGWRYVVATIPITLAGQLLLYYLHAHLGMGGALANLLAFTLLVGPQYALNRHWVWASRQETGRLPLEVTWFWVIGAAGLAVSTGFVAVAERTLDNPLWVNAASLTGFGVVWVVKFFVLDRLLFADRVRGRDA